MGCFVFTFLQAEGFFCNFFKQKLGQFFVTSSSKSLESNLRSKSCLHNVAAMLLLLFTCKIVAFMSA
jgi:hypothetical protein